MPVSVQHHRVTIGLFQGRTMMCQNYCDFELIYIILKWMTVGILCGIARVSMCILLDCLSPSVVRSYNYQGIYVVPVIYDVISCVLVCAFYISPLMNLIMNFTPSKHKIHSVTSYLEAVNFLLICCNPILYNFRMTLILLSGDVEPNPGPPGLSICHINIRSLSPVKLLAIRQEIVGNYDIISLSETFLSSESSHNLEIPGFYPIFRLDRPNFGGGVACYISNILVAKRRVDLELLGAECLWLEVRSKNNKFLLCTCYRPPDESVQFWEDLQFMVDQARLGDINHIIISGDLNADPSTVNGTKLSQFVTSNDLTLHIQEPTRITETTSSILDQFITNIPEHVYNAKVDPPLLTNDHCTISIKLNFKIPKVNAIERVIWVYKDADWEGFNNAIQNYDWDSLLWRK